MKRPVRLWSWRGSWGLLGASAGRVWAHGWPERRVQAHELGCVRRREVLHAIAHLGALRPCGPVLAPAGAGGHHLMEEGPAIAAGVCRMRGRVLPT